MKFEVQQVDLIKALTALSRMITKVPKESYLQNVKITKLNNNHIRLVASDMTHSLQYDIEANNIVGEGILYNLTHLTSIISRLEGVITFDSNVIKTRKSKFKISSASVDLYPEINFECEAQKYTVDVVELNNAISKTLYATSKLCNSVLSGIYFSDGDVVATDSNRMTIKKISSNLPEFILPRVMGEEFLRLFADGLVDFKFDGNKIYVSNEEIVFTGCIMAGVYPKYKLLLPQTFEHSIKFKNNELTKALTLLTPILDAKAMICLLTIDEKMATLSGYSLSSEGETELELSESDITEEKNIGFNAQYLLDMLKNFDENITMQFNEVNKAIIFTDNSDNYSLIMPISGVKKCKN